MTVELDEERGPHVRVTMSSEPPAFLGLFSGAFVVHLGKRGSNGSGSALPNSPSGNGDGGEKRRRWGMYLVRGEAVEETHLTAISISREHLRSRGCVLLVGLVSCVVHLWHGAKALRHTRKVSN